MKTHFSKNQFDGAYADGMEHYWWDVARNRIVATAIQAFVGAKARVLDVGCGRGITVKSLRDMNIDCSGVEIAEVQPIDSAKQYIQVGLDAVELSDSERQRYNTILLLDVIEHLPEPVAFLRNLAHAFSNLSYVIVTVPARQELWSNYDEYYGHFRRYTPEMLEALSSELGWDIKWKSYFFHLLYIPAWLIIKRGKTRQTLLKPPQKLTKWFHKLISYAMILDYHLFPSRLAGTSIIGIFHIKKSDG